MSFFPETTILTDETVKVIRKAAKDGNYDNSYYVVAVTRREHPTVDPSHDGQSGRSDIPGTQTSWLRISRTHRQPAGAEPSEVRYDTEIPTLGAIAIYGESETCKALRSWSNPVGFRIVASQACYISEKTSIVKSLASVVRAGDQLEIAWVLGNDTDNLRNAGMTHDLCYIRVIRNEKYLVEFILDDAICPVGSTALFASTSYIGKPGT